MLTSGFKGNLQPVLSSRHTEPQMSSFYLTEAIAEKALCLARSHLIYRLSHLPFLISKQFPIFISKVQTAEAEISNSMLSFGQPASRPR